MATRLDQDISVTDGDDSRSNGHTIVPSAGQQPSTEVRLDTLSNSRSSSMSSSSSSMQYAHPVPPPYLPGGARSLPAISLRAFCLGIGAGMCACLTILLFYIENLSEMNPYHATTPATYGVGYLWRIPFFVMTLSTFHYLEFYMTARYNTVDAKVSSFLLFNNGWAYNVAHCLAMFECLVTWFFRSEFAFHLPSLDSFIPSMGEHVARLRNMASLPTVPSYLPILLGLVLTITGQVTRSLAMKTAGTSFNHIVQATKKVDHVLVTRGVYGLCRHPSYFGFFWWALGTQLLLGNRICLLGYSFILWKFFSHRIENEERHLIYFFGQAYVEYRNKTPVLIPLIW